MDLTKDHTSPQEDEATMKYKEVLEKVIDFVKRDEYSYQMIHAEDLLNKIIGFAAAAGLEDIKEKVLDVKNQETA